MTKVLIIESRSHQDIAEISLRATQQMLTSYRVGYDIISVFQPLDSASALNISMEAYEYEGAIALGCIFQDGWHSNITGVECIRMLNKVALSYVLPLGVGIILSTDEASALGKAQAHAEDATRSCLQLINIKQKLHFIDNERHPKYNN